MEGVLYLQIEKFQPIAHRPFHTSRTVVNTAAEPKFLLRDIKIYKSKHTKKTHSIYAYYKLIIIEKTNYLQVFQLFRI